MIANLKSIAKATKRNQTKPNQTKNSLKFVIIAMANNLIKS